MSSFIYSSSVSTRPIGSNQAFLEPRTGTSLYPLPVLAFPSGSGAGDPSQAIKASTFTLHAFGEVTIVLPSPRNFLGSYNVTQHAARKLPPRQTIVGACSHLHRADSPTSSASSSPPVLWISQRKHSPLPPRFCRCWGPYSCPPIPRVTLVCAS